jgi:hypothetical protein
LATNGHELKSTEYIRKKSDRKKWQLLRSKKHGVSRNGHRPHRDAKRAKKGKSFGGLDLNQNQDLLSFATLRLCAKMILHFVFCT